MIPMIKVKRKISLLPASLHLFLGLLLKDSHQFVPRKPLFWNVDVIRRQYINRNFSFLCIISKIYVQISLDFLLLFFYGFRTKQ
jgi:hypothetical protein